MTAQKIEAVLIARTVPEQSKKYGVRVCSVFYSDFLKSLIRVYPLPVMAGIKAWDRVTLHLERNNLDNRRESFKLVRDDESCIEFIRKESKEDVLGEVRRYATRSINLANTVRQSIAFVNATECNVSFKKRKGTFGESQLRLFEDENNDIFVTARDYCRCPYLDFTDEDGIRRSLQIREWGCFERLRKGVVPDLSRERWPSWAENECELIVGNMNSHRNVWMVIHGFKCRSKEMPLFLSKAGTLIHAIQSIESGEYQEE